LTGAGTLVADLTVVGSGTLLLDLYPNAAAAYSLRKLRTAYTGNAIRVRRSIIPSGQPSEQDIGFTTLGVLDESALTTFCGVGDGFVTTWYDQSGSANNATETTAVSQPRIVLNGIVDILNNKPALFFNNSFLTNTTDLINATNPAISTFSVFNVISDNNLIYNFMTPTAFGNVTSGSFYIIRNASGNVIIQFRASATNSRTYDTNGRFNPTQQLISHIDSGSNIIIYKNNISIISATSSLGVFSGTMGYSIGYVQGSTVSRLKGYFNEYIIYTNSQSSNRINIQTNINTHYAIY
jgi:hypothetical protein